MLPYVLRRLGTAIPVLIGVTLLTYLLVNLAPGDPVDALVNPMAGQQVREAERIAFGLDQPVYLRYVHWLGAIVHGNLGYSYADYQPVAAILAERIGATALLAVSALVIAYVVGVGLGLLSAMRPYSRIDFAATTLGIAGVSVPSFFIGLVFIYAVSLKLPILPSGGMVSVGSSGSIGDLARHLVLPAVTLSLFDLALVVRYTRAAMLDVVDQDYMRTARGKGLTPRRVLLVHGLRNALNPVITQLGLSIPRLLGGSVVVESVFQWPGLGTLAIQAIAQRDYPVIMGLGLVVAVLVVIGGLLADLLYGLADPRIRYGHAGR